MSVNHIKNSGNHYAIAHPELYGLDEQHLVFLGDSQLEKQTATAFTAMQAAAALDNIDLQICSAYRPFDRQLSIWNAKASGKRVLLDADSCPIDFSHLNEQQLIDSILLWSALPGASRHHWGTDIDVFDASKIEQSALKLVSAEYAPNGPCHTLYLWLIDHAQQFGFYFPYQKGLSGVSPEPWHLSYYPVSSQYLSRFSCSDLAKVLSDADISLKSPLLTQLTTLVNHYVFFVAPSPC